MIGLVFILWTAQEAGSEAILRDTGIRSGLAVHLGSTEGSFEAGLTSQGHILVHGIALDDSSLIKSRNALRAKGLYGLATVERGVLDPLPYADNLVNLLVADAALTGFSEKEALRVLAPGGVLVLRKGGAWTKTVKARPKEMDDWTHFDYGPEGNGVSHDRLIMPATHVQWSFGAQPVKLGGNPAGYRVFTGFRSSGGRVFFEWTDAAEKKSRDCFFTGRDAFNGLPIWTVKNSGHAGRKEWQFVASGGRVYTFLEKGGAMVAMDASTGKVEKTYAEGVRLTDEVNLTSIRIGDEAIVQTANDTLCSLDPKSGALQWKHVADKSIVLFPSVAMKERRVFAVVAEDRKLGSFSRWPFIKAQAIVCFDLGSGKELWRCAEVAGSDIGQLVYSDKSLAVFGSGAIGGSKEPYLGCIDPENGKLLWHSTFKTAYNRFGYNLLVRDGVMYYADAWRIYRLDLKTGQETVPFDDGGFNMRCNRFSATEDWLIYGYVAYVDRDWKGAYQSITRGGCAQGSVPANGLMYFTPQACGCFTMLRGHLALSSETLREPIPDALRLQKGTLPKEDPSTKPGIPAGPVAEDWIHPDRGLLGRSLGEAGVRTVTEPAAVGGKSIVADIHGHRIIASDADGKPVWSFTAGGRISSAPIVSEGLCLFGSHDGWVYALKADDGALVWRFQGAPYDRKIVVNGQLESSWPVYGVVLHEGLICFSAGLHPEAGGGIYVYGAEPGAGTLKWKKVLRKSLISIDGSQKKKPPVVPNRILNEVLKSDGNSLSLPGIVFDPRTTEEELRAKIEQPIQKKK